MDLKDIQTSIGSYTARLKRRENDAIGAIRDGSYWAAQVAISDCVGYKAVIEELEYQREVMEVNNA